MDSLNSLSFADEFPINSTAQPLTAHQAVPGTDDDDLESRIDDIRNNLLRVPLPERQHEVDLQVAADPIDQPFVGLDMPEHRTVDPRPLRREAPATTSLNSCSSREEVPLSEGDTEGCRLRPDDSRIELRADPAFPRFPKFSRCVTRHPPAIAL